MNNSSDIVSLATQQKICFVLNSNIPGVGWRDFAAKLQEIGIQNNTWLTTPFLDSLVVSGWDPPTLLFKSWQLHSPNDFNKANLEKILRRLDLQYLVQIVKEDNTIRVPRYSTVQHLVVSRRYTQLWIITIAFYMVALLLEPCIHQQEISKLQDKLEKVQDKLEKVQDKLEKVQDKLEKVQEENSKLKEKLEKQEEVNSNSEHINNEKDKEIMELNFRLSHQESFPQWLGLIFAYWIFQDELNKK